MNTGTYNRSRLQRCLQAMVLPVFLLLFLLAQVVQAEHIHGVEFDDQLHCELCQSGSGEPAVVSTASADQLTHISSSYLIADRGLSQTKRLRSWQARAPPISPSI